jgi:DNA helicase-2/ATP-dependent DNA helicase PcrA
VFALLEGLNEEQRAAVTHADPVPLRVLAGAGTGKTTVLAARVAWLLAQGTPPERVLLLTFTRRAARQMLQRTAARLDQAGADVGRAGRVSGGTFHAVAHRVLRRYATALGLPEHFSVLDPVDAADLIDLVREDSGQGWTTGRRFPRKALLADLYSRAVNTGRPVSAVVAEVAPWADADVEAIISICQAYVERKRSRGLLDFDDLLLYWRAAAADERLGPVLAGAFDHVLVDEYQDVNDLQVDLLRSLRAPDPRLSVVGDDAQAVYSFRAAEPRHILDFPADFPGARTVVLQTNYRSRQPVLDVANAVGAEAPWGFSAVLTAAERAAGPRPRLVRCADEDAETHAVCQQVLAHREEGMALRDQAVLMRAAHHSQLLELELSARRIPFVKYGGLRFLEAAHVKDVMAAFLLADNASDELAWFRLLQLLEGVGPVTARRVVAGLGLGLDRGPAHLEADAAVLGRWDAAADALPAAARPGADRLVAAVAEGRGATPVVRAAQLVAALTPLLSAAYPDAAARLRDLDTLVAGADRVARVSDLAAELALEAPRSSADLAGPPVVDEDWLTLSTVHSAKGLEWDAVHVLHVTDGMVPSDMALATAKGVEEERRIFYVALTRARRAQHLCQPLRYHFRPRGRGDGHGLTQRSRFLSPAVVERCETVDALHHAWDLPGSSPAVPAGAAVAGVLDRLWS